MKGPKGKEIYPDPLTMSSMIATGQESDLAGYRMKQNFAEVRSAQGRLTCLIPTFSPIVLLYLKKSFSFAVKVVPGMSRFP